MTPENSLRRDLVAREMDLLLAERDRVENEFDLSDENDDPEGQRARAWLDRLHSRHVDLQVELDGISPGS